MRGFTSYTRWKAISIETPGADYPPPDEFTEDLENEDIPPEKLPKRRRGRIGGEKAGEGPPENARAERRRPPRAA